MVLLVLFLLLRSLVASLLVVAAVVLSYLAALGLAHRRSRPRSASAAWSRRCRCWCSGSWCAFGVDYGIFPLARIAEDRKELGTTVATRRAVTVTAPVIASAGLVLAATFAVLASLPFVPMVELGVAVAAGVLLQTLLVAPALLAPVVVGLRRWIWWPSRSTDDPQPAATEADSGSDTRGWAVRRGRAGGRSRCWSARDGAEDGEGGPGGSRRWGIGRFHLLLTAALLILPVAALPRDWLDGEELDALGYTLFVLATLPLLIRRRYPIQALLFCVTVQMGYHALNYTHE